MDEKIINLLKKCLEVQKKGYNVLFGQNTGLVTIMQIVDREVTVSFCIFTEHPEGEDEKAETFLNTLIGSDIK